MTLLPADYLLTGVAVVAAVTGLFRGFSGTVAFFCGAAAATAVGFFGWSLSAVCLQVTWMRAIAVLVALLLVFGLVRIFVKRLVNGLLSQPTDALLGLAVGCVFGLIPLAIWAWSGFDASYSALVGEVRQYVR